MKFLIALFLLAVSGAIFAGYAVEIWDGRIGHHDPELRIIDYSSKHAL
jgi:hypothetical protein